MTPRALLNPEASLLLACLQAQLHKDNNSGATHHLGDSDEINWTLFLDHVRNHAVLPLVYKQLGTVCKDVPDFVLETLQRQYRLHLGTNTALTHQLLAILSLFQREGIAAIPFKGPSLAVLAYGDLALRPFSDLDIFVRRGDATQAKEVLQAQGFKVVFPTRQQDERAWLRSHYHYTLTDADRALDVEIHWGIAPSFLSFAVDEASLWQRADSLVIQGQTVSRFSLEDQFMLLCIHGSRHLWERLGWLCDIAQLTQRPIVWPQLLAQAQRLGGERVLLLSLLLCHELLGGSLPSELAGRVQQDKSLHRLADIVYEGLFRSASVRQKSAPTFFWTLQIRRRDRARLLFHLLRGKL